VLHTRGAKDEANIHLKQQPRQLLVRHHTVRHDGNPLKLLNDPIAISPLSDQMHLKIPSTFTQSNPVKEILLSEVSQVHKAQRSTAVEPRLALWLKGVGVHTVGDHLNALMLNRLCYALVGDSDNFGCFKRSISQNGIDLRE
jgi:hypothetical protein